MPNITLPDGSVRTYDATTTGIEIAESIGKSLARDAVALRVDGELYDLTRPIDADVAVEIITRDSDTKVTINTTKRYKPRNIQNVQLNET